MKKLLELPERGLVPDWLICWGIRRLLVDRLRHERRNDRQEQLDVFYDFLDTMRDAPVAVQTDAANEQHYEVPAGFFEKVLGPRLKYSCCYWPEGVETLEAAEDAMLELTCARAELDNGQDVLELGCGWGALTLWMAEHYPDSRITAVSNSSGQRAFIEQRAADRGLSNVTVITADMNDFSIDQTFDRVVSLEMFEHMRNVGELFRRVSGWLTTDGRLFIHVFTHRELPYFFETEGATHWMGRYFFTGGMMPSEDLYLHLQDHLLLERHWRVNGRHYGRTLRAWLAGQDEQRDTIMPIMAEVYGETEKVRWFNRWRIFFLACAELFDYTKGEEWYVTHYLFRRRD